MNNWFSPKRETWMYHVNPAIKFLVFIGLFVIILYTHRLDFILYQFLGYAALLFLSSGYALRKLLLLTLPFIFIFVSSSMTMILFGKGETLWWSWGLFRITEESFFRGIHIGFKTLSCAATGLLFALTTRPTMLFYAMMQQLRLPPKYAYAFMASFRMLPILWEELQIRQQALAVRGVRSAHSIRGWKERLLNYAVPLLAQSIRRAQRIAVAMEAKRFAAQASTAMRTYYYKTSVTSRDGFFLFIILVMVTVAFFASREIPLFNVGDVRG
ncbi:energy-coupling factor transporter transmembrane component T [Paenibacillus terrigena]|uniref:energy-coupling factor transporter transmembrane component T family protein n=1 Tax=Paenibacillus terrigena TaxID=369333 RepID=UPI0028D22F08|nr:energy-coupling factor transporter transmembrane component T [Paenibacillus terrigena]